jgi:transcription antitermination factor NusA-like protein
LKSGILCSKCETLLKEGKIDQLDIDVAKILLDLQDSHPILQEINFLKAVESGPVLAIVLSKGDVKKILSSGGKIIRGLSERTGKRIKILEGDCSLRRFLEELFAPASILTINTIWLPDGTTETKVILSYRDSRHLPSSVATLKELAGKIRDVVLSVELERM